MTTAQIEQTIATANASLTGFTHAVQDARHPSAPAVCTSGCTCCTREGKR